MFSYKITYIHNYYACRPTKTYNDSGDFVTNPNESQPKHT